MPRSEKEFCPEAGTKIQFAGATLYARKIDIKPQLVALTAKHRGRIAKVDDGWIIIDQEWYAK